MTRLDRLLLRRLAAGLAGVFVFVAAVAVTSQLVNLIVPMIDAGAGGWVAVRLFLFNLPAVAATVMPFCLLVAMLWMLDAMQADGEVPVILAAGWSPMRLVAAPVVLSTAVAAGMLASSLWLDPLMRRDLRDLSTRLMSDAVVLISARPTLSEIGRGLHVRSGPRDAEGRINGLFLLDRREAGRETLYLARSAFFVEEPAGLSLVMEGGEIRGFGERPRDTYVIDFDRFVVAPSFFLPDLPLRYRPREVPTALLWRIAAADPQAVEAGFRGSRVSLPQARAELARRFSDWLYAPLFAAIAVWAFVRWLRRGQVRGRQGVARLASALGIALLLRVAGFVLLGQATGSLFFAVLTVAMPAVAALGFALAAWRESKQGAPAATILVPAAGAMR